MADVNAFGGSGWRFPVRVVETGANPGTIAATADGEEAVRDAIWMILSTSPGERVMRPDYGCGIDDHVFGDLGAATIGGIERDVTEALQEWEPRIDVVSVEARADPRDRTTLLVGITYVMRSTNSRLNLVYPFYLE